MKKNNLWLSLAIAISINSLCFAAFVPPAGRMPATTPNQRLISAIQNDDPTALQTLIAGDDSLLDKSLAPELTRLNVVVTPLIFAIMYKKENAAKQLIALGANPNIRFIRQTGNRIITISPLYLAIDKGLLEITKLLLEKGAKIEKSYSEEGPYPVPAKNLLAMVQQQKKFAEELIKILEQHKKIQAAEKEPILSAAELGLIEAIRNGHLEDFKAIIKRDPELVNRSLKISSDSVYSERKVAIIARAKKEMKDQGNLKYVSKWFSKRAKKDEQKPNYWSETMTPLYLAALNKRYDIIKELLAQGANPNKGLIMNFSLNFALDPSNKADDYYAHITNRPLFYAVQKGDEKLAEILLRTGRTQLNDGYSLVIKHQKDQRKGVFSGSPDYFVFLQSPLSFAVQQQNSSMIKLLKNKNAKAVYEKKYPAKIAKKQKQQIQPQKKQKIAPGMYEEEPVGVRVK